MCRWRRQAVAVEHLTHLLRCPAEIPCELDLAISDLREAGERAGHVTLHVVPDAVQLDSHALETASGRRCSRLGSLLRRTGLPTGCGGDRAHRHQKVSSCDHGAIMTRTVTGGKRCRLPPCY